MIFVRFFEAPTASEGRVGGISSNATLIVHVPSHQDVAIHPPVSSKTLQIKKYNDVS